MRLLPSAEATVIEEAKAVLAALRRMPEDTFHACDTEVDGLDLELVSARPLARPSLSRAGNLRHGKPNLFPTLHPAQHIHRECLADIADRRRRPARV